MKSSTDRICSRSCGCWLTATTTRARFLVLGSAGPNLLQQSAESLAGRIEYIELAGLQVAEVGPALMSRLWIRGGFPRSFLAATDADSTAWRKAFVRTFVERDLPQFGAELRAPALHRFLAMLAHYHGRILNVAELSTALNVAQATVRRYLDLLEQLFLIRQLRPWHENLRKRQVKRPKLYVRDHRPVPPPDWRRDDGCPADPPAHRRLVGGIRS